MRRTNEPKPKTRASKPYDLDELESQIWDQYAPQMIELGLLTGIDSETFATWCRVSAKIRMSPTVRLNANDVCQQRLLGAAFGMTPADRPRLSVPEKEQPKSVAGLR